MTTTLRPRSTVLLLAAVMLCCRAGPVAAETLRAAERDLVNFAFATQLGSGIYSLDGRTIQVYRLPFAWTLSEPRGSRPGVRFRFPATIGLYDFRLDDIVDDGIPTDLDTFSAAAGIELDFPLGRDWHVLPYVEAGRAWDFGGGTEATLYSAAVHARRDFEQGERRLRFNAGAVYAAVDLAGAGGHSSLLKLETGIEARWPLGFQIAGSTLDGGPYGLVEWYADRPGEPVERSTQSSAIPVQMELGFTLGTRPAARLWGMPLPRVGLAFRFGEDLAVYRLVFGSPF